MFILKDCEKISIVTTEKDLLENQEKIQILFNQKLYDPISFKCMSDTSQRKLHPNMRKEYIENRDEAFEKFGELAKTFSKKTLTGVGTMSMNGTEFAQGMMPGAPSTLGGGFGEKLEQMFMQVLAQQSVEKVVEMASPEIEKMIIEKFGVLPQIHEVVTPKGTNKFEGVVHEKFDQILSLVNLHIPVYLSGEAGTGKNVICQQVAEGLGLEFYFTNAITQEYQLKGFTDANGNYQESQFYKAFKDGGLFFLDEMDGSIPEALIILNSAIANGYFDFPAPIGKVEAHEDFRIISAGNTVGTGADIEYTGRFQLDASSLDRFALVEIGYSPAIEEAVTNKNKELCEFARMFRKITKECSIKCLFSYRSMERISKMEEIFELPEVLKMSLTKGLGKDDLRIISKRFTEKGLTNKYTQALGKVKAH